MKSISYFLVVFSLVFSSAHAEEKKVDKKSDYDCEKASVVYRYLSNTKSPQFDLKSAAEDLYVGGLLQIDGRFFVGEHQNKSTFLIRRARFFFTGTLYDSFKYLLIGRYDNMIADIYQAWVEYSCYPWASIRFGLYKEPFSLQALDHDAYLTFVERCLVIFNYIQNNDIGVMLYGKTADERIEYGIGFFNGRGENFDNNNNKELVGRFVYGLLGCPEYGTLYLGVSGSTGRMREDLSATSFRTSGATKFFTWSVGSRERGGLNRWGTDLEYYHGPFRFAAEYLYTNWGRIDLDTRATRFWGQGAYCEASYLLTGEDRPRNGPVIPFNNFDCCFGGGAIEVAARYEVFFASKNVIRDGMAFGANQAHGPALAFNWYFNPFVVLRIDAQYLKFNRDVFVNRLHPIHYEGLITCRLQARF